jgi:hypothetical protein
MHVPASFAKEKSKLTKKLYRVGKDVDVKQPWNWVNDLKSLGQKALSTEGS